MNLPYLQAHNDGVVLSVRVTPKSSKSDILGEHGQELKISIKAPPTDGQANKELIRFIAKTFQVSKSEVVLMCGETSRSKKVFVNCTFEQAIGILAGITFSRV